MKEFKINKYITLKLIGIKHKETIIYVDDEEFMQCKYLLIINPHEKRIQKEIRSIDEAKELIRQDLEKQLNPIDLGITPEDEFWGHCSNLQVWVENDYNVSFARSFPSESLTQFLRLPLIKRCSLVRPKSKK